MARALTLDHLKAQLSTVISASDARALVNRLSRIAGVPDNRPLGADELTLVLSALSAEGGMIEQIAQTIAAAELPGTQGEA
jgi:hypothetical protein